MRKLLKGLPDRIVRLLAEMRVEILWHNTPDNKNPFVSLRRRELKFVPPCIRCIHHNSSSPYGDVS